MARTLQQILIDANSYLDLDASLPIGDDLTVRTEYAKQAVREWADAYRWRELSTPYSVLATSATISLPTGFKELEAIPQDSSGEYYPEVRVADRLTQDDGDKFSFITGNEVTGYVMTLENLPNEDTTISLTYQRQASVMATLTDICEVPDDQFVVKKIISYVLQSRSDERFPTVESEAQRLLSNMIGRSMSQTSGGSNRMRRTGSAAYAIGSARG